MNDGVSDIGGQAGEAVSSVVKGAAAGAAKGGASGAVVGAVKGAVTTTGGRRSILFVAVASFLPVLLAAIMLSAMMMPASGPGSTMKGQTDGYSVALAASAGLTPAQVATIKEATVSSGVQWQLVAAAFASVKTAATNVNPFAITDPLVAQQGSTLESAAALIGSRLAKALQQQPAFRYGQDIADGASVDSTGQVVWESGSEQTRQDRRDAYAAALATLPLPNVSETWGQTIYDRALEWRLGQSPAGCAAPVSAAPSATGSSSSSPTSTGTTTDLVVTSSTGVSVHVTDTILRNVAITVKVATDNNLPQQAMVIAVMTMAVESGWRNLASAAVPESLAFPNDGVVPGDHDSVNAFQQRAYTGYWGTPAQLMDPVYAASMFFGLNPAGAPENHAPGLLQISGWETMPPGEAAQAVQVSAFPDRYAAWQDAAVQLIQAAAGIDVSMYGGCSSGFTPGSIPTEDTYGPYWQSVNGRVDGVDPWTFYWGECVSYAAWMVRTTTTYSDFTNYWHHNGISAHFGNAYEWQAAAVAVGIPVSQTPAVGSIALHVRGLFSYPVGHVAFVTGVNADGTINVSEYNFAGRHIYGTRQNLAIGSGGEFQFFLHFEQAGH